MNYLQAAVIATIALVPAIADAQIKTLPGETHTVSATVDAIEHASRSLTLKKPDDSLVTITVPKEYLRFDALKVGDKVTVTYYDNIVIRAKAPGEKDVDSGGASLIANPGNKPGFTVGAQRSITATITAIDLKVPSISLSGPSNWKYSSRVNDKDALKQVKVGDKLDIVWTEAVMLSTTPPK
jgi:hypothetical protein